MSITYCRRVSHGLSINGESIVAPTPHDKELVNELRKMELVISFFSSNGKVNADLELKGLNHTVYLRSDPESVQMNVVDLPFNNRYDHKLSVKDTIIKAHNALQAGDAKIAENILSEVISDMITRTIKQRCEDSQLLVRARKGMNLPASLEFRLPPCVFGYTVFIFKVSKRQIARLTR